jgi:hypothetical protein
LYDIIIYGSYYRGMPFYDLVNTIYQSNKIILLCGEDIRECDYSQYVDAGHNVFVKLVSCLCGIRKVSCNTNPETVNSNESFVL